MIHPVKDHVKIEHAFQCEKCNETFKFEDSLKHHFNSQHVFRCEECNAPFEFQELLNNHVTLNHNNIFVSIFKCDMCNFMCKNRDSLIDHKSFHPIVISSTKISTFEEAQKFQERCKGRDKYFPQKSKLFRNRLKNFETFPN